MGTWQIVMCCFCEVFGGRLVIGINAVCQPLGPGTGAGALCAPPSLAAVSPHSDEKRSHPSLPPTSSTCLAHVTPMTAWHQAGQGWVQRMHGCSFLPVLLLCSPLPRPFFPPCRCSWPNPGPWVSANTSFSFASLCHFTASHSASCESQPSGNFNT